MLRTGEFILPFWPTIVYTLIGRLRSFLPVFANSDGILTCKRDGYEGFTGSRTADISRIGMYLGKRLVSSCRARRPFTNDRVRSGIRRSVRRRHSDTRPGARPGHWRRCHPRILRVLRRKRSEREAARLRVRLRARTSTHDERYCLPENVSDRRTEIRDEQDNALVCDKSVLVSQRIIAPNVLQNLKRVLTVVRRICESRRESLM